MTKIAFPSSFAGFDSLPDSALIDVRTYARLLDCSENTVWRRAKAKALPAPIRVSSQQTRWRVGDVRKALVSTVTDRDGVLFFFGQAS